MRWIEEPNKHNLKSPYQALITEPGQPLALAFVEYWKRILGDGSQSSWCPRCRQKALADERPLTG